MQEARQSHFSYSYFHAGATTTGTSFLTWDGAYVALVIACLALHVVLYMRLYRSDPGWVDPGGGQAAEGGRHRQMCPHCGAFPPERSKHDFRTGVGRKCTL